MNPFSQMPTYLEIAVNVPQVSDVFHYHLPPELEGRVQVGHLVLVPFGSRTVQGIVFREVDRPDVVETRPVLELVDEAAVVTQDQIILAQKLAHDCLAPLAACLGLMLPPGIDQQADVLYTPQGDIPAGISVVQTRLMKLLHKRGPLRGHANRSVDASYQLESIAKNVNAPGFDCQRSRCTAGKSKTKDGQDCQRSLFGARSSFGLPHPGQGNYPGAREAAVHARVALPAVQSRGGLLAV